MEAPRVNLGKALAIVISIVLFVGLLIGWLIWG